jgi:hypothetical protein
VCKVVFALKKKANEIAWCPEKFVLCFGDDEK